MGALATVSLTDAALGVALIALGLVLGYAVRQWRLASPLSPRARALPTALLVGVVAVIVVLSLDSTRDEEGRAQLLAGLGIAAAALLLWAIGPTRVVAKERIEHEEPGEEQIIEPGEWVTPTIAKREEAEGRVEVSYRAKEPFTLDGEQIEKGQKLPKAAATQEEAKPHVRVVRVAKQRIVFSESKKTGFEKGAEVPEDFEAKYPGKIERRIVFAPGRLFIGKDGRWSTSKLTSLLWTLAAAWALISLLIATRIFEVKLDLSGNGTGFSDLNLPAQYYLLLGGPFAAALLAKAFTTTKVENGTIVKLEKPAEGNPIAGLREVLSNDENTNDLVDTQYFMFNLIALAYFFIAFIGGLTSGFPDIPEVLYGLTSAAALTYTAKKGLERSVPLILSANPTTVRPGEKISVWGRNLAPGGEPPAVEIGGRSASPVEIVPSGQLDTDHLRVAVPVVPAGRAGLVVTPKDGTPTDAFELAVQTAEITTVAPEPVPLRPGQRIAITGSGFGGVEGDVTLGGEGLIVRGWSPSAIVAEVAPERRYPLSNGSAVLDVRVGSEVAVRETKAEAIVISDVEPKELEAKPGATLVLSGRGFTAFPVEATLAGRPLARHGVTDTQLVVRLRSNEDYPLGTAWLVVTAPPGYEDKAQVSLIKAGGP